jgi:O-antigen/teichoic acid export membrane protein
MGNSCKTYICRLVKKIKDKAIRLNKDGNLSELLKSSGFVLVFKVLGAISGYVFAFVVSKYGADTYGIYELAFTALMILSVIVKWGLDGATVRFTQEYLVSGDKGKIRSLVSKSVFTIFISALVVGLLFFLLRKSLAEAFDEPNLEKAYVWVAVGLLPFVLLQYYSEALRALKNMKAFSVFQVGSVLILASAIFILLKDIALSKGEIATLAFVISTAVFAFGAYLIFQKSFRIRVGDIPAEQIDFKSVLKVGVPLLISGSLFLVISWTDTLMIGYYKSSTDVGIYRIAFKVATLITFIQFAVNSIAAPTIASLYAEDDLTALRKYIKYIGVINAAFAIPITLFIIVFSEPLLNLFGAEYTSGMVLLPILAIGQLVNALAGPVMYILNMTGKEKLSQRIMIWMTGLNIILNVVLIPRYGIVGAAIATTISMVTWNVIAAFYVYKYYKVIAIPFVK